MMPLRTKLLVLVAALACLGAAVNRLELPVGKGTVPDLAEANPRAEYRQADE